MKKNCLFVALMMTAIMCFGNLSAQEQPAKQKKQRPTAEQIMDMQVSGMQKRLMLDDETAAKFAPLYKEYLESLKACRPEKPQGNEPKKELTDKDIDQQMQQQWAMQKKIIEVKETYYAKFKKILTMRQVKQVFQSNAKPRMGKPNNMFKQGPHMDKGCPMQGEFKKPRA